MLTILLLREQDYKGKVLLIFNGASKCGFTKRELCTFGLRHRRGAGTACRPLC